MVDTGKDQNQHISWLKSVLLISSVRQRSNNQSLAIMKPRVHWEASHWTPFNVSPKTQDCLTIIFRFP